MNFDHGRVGNTSGKGENAGYQHFLLFSQCFQKPPVSVSLKGKMCDKELRFDHFSFMTGFIPLQPLSIVCRKAAMAWNEYCVEWLNELQESMDRCFGCHDITEITPNVNQSNNQLIIFPCRNCVVMVCCIPIMDQMDVVVHVVF